MPRKKTDQTRSSLTIAAVLHAILIGAVVFWAYKTGNLEKAAQMLGIIPQQRKTETPPPQTAKPPSTQQTPQAQLPPIASSSRPSTGTRRAVAGDAPASAGGGSFFQDTRVQTTGPSTAATAPPPAPTPPPPPQVKAPPRVELLPPRATGAGSVVKLDRERLTAKRVQDSIGAEQMSRGVGSSAGDAVAKVTGTTVVDGKFVVVRGLSDRYTSTTLNGGDIPSADPYRKSVQLDLVPANMVESIVVTKTFTPDQPGGFTGGAINILTKSFPEKRMMSFTAGTGYNSQTTGKDYLSSVGGQDWTAMDDGSRALSENLTGVKPSDLSGPSTSGVVRNNQGTADRIQFVLQQLGPAQFAGVKKTAPPNQSYAFSMGDTVNVFTKPLGYFVGVNYKRDYNTYSDGLLRRYTADFNRPEIRRDLKEERGTEETAWGSVVNLAYKPHPDHEVGFTFVYNQVGEDTARHLEGYNVDNNPDVLVQDQLFYTERNLNTYQFKGKHELPQVRDMKIDWLVSLSNTSQDEPDARFFHYTKSTNAIPSYQLGFSGTDPIRPSRYFRQLEENNLNWKLDDTLPFRLRNGQEGEIKFGLLQSFSDRTFAERTFAYAGDSGFGTSGDPNRYLTADVLTYIITRQGRNTNYNFQRFFDNVTIGNNRYVGNQEVGAQYGMVELPLTRTVRILGGVRMETTDLDVTAFNPNQGSTNGTIQANDLLPGAGLVINLRSNMNLRFNFGRTIARPTYREFAPVTIYDIPTDTLVEGNPRLERSQIDNYDVRWEWFPRAGEVLSLSAFYKDISKPIERFSSDLTDGTVSYVNFPSAKVFGLELEARKALDFLDPILSPFSAGMNLSLIGSEVPLDAATMRNKRRFGYTGGNKRSLYDQSPYVLNADITYNNPSVGTTATIQTSMAGKRIFVATGAGEDVYEHPPMGLDFVLTQRLTRNLKLKFTARNLLDLPYRRSYGQDATQYSYSSYRRGRLFSLSLTCDL